MDKIVLTRIRSKSNEHETFGRLKFRDQIFYTVEQPWNENKKYISCIPEGEYVLSPWHSYRFGACYILANRELNVVKENGGPFMRDNILIHPANFAAQLRGCIAPGMRIGVLNYKGKPTNAVLSSKAAFDQLTSLLGREQFHTLQIKWED